MVNSLRTFDNITKSTNDKRFYRGIILENGLKCLLINDPTTDRSAASLTVSTGLNNILIIKLS